MGLQLGGTPVNEQILRQSASLKWVTPKEIQGWPGLQGWSAQSPGKLQSQKSFHAQAPLSVDTKCT